MASAQIMAGENKLKVRRVDLEKAMGSTGMFPAMWRVGRVRATEVVAKILEDSPVVASTPGGNTARRRRRGSRRLSSSSAMSAAAESQPPASGKNTYTVA